jgi:prephenate dehydratase
VIELGAENNIWQPRDWVPDVIFNKSIATLGSPETAITCSMDAVKVFYPDAALEGVDSFEEACLDVVEGRVKYAFVPVAYPKLNTFLMDSRLVIADYRVRAIPPLVLVHKNKTTCKNIDKLFLHPATEPLIKKINIEFQCLEYCFSNEDAASKLFDGVDNNAAITNLLAAEAFSLQVSSTLRPEAPMGWLLLKSSSLNEQ